MALDEDKINNEDKLEKISGGQDGDPPFSEPDDVKPGDDRNAQHPVTDANVDEDEEYNEGAQAAAGLQTDEHPDEDERATRIA